MDKVKKIQTLGAFIPIVSFISIFIPVYKEEYTFAGIHNLDVVYLWDLESFFKHFWLIVVIIASIILIYGLVKYSSDDDYKANILIGAIAIIFMDFIYMLVGSGISKDEYITAYTYWPFLLDLIFAIPLFVVLFKKEENTAQYAYKTINEPKKEESTAQYNNSNNTISEIKVEGSVEPIEKDENEFDIIIEEVDMSEENSKEKIPDESESEDINVSDGEQLVKFANKTITAHVIQSEEEFREYLENEAPWEYRGNFDETYDFPQYAGDVDYIEALFENINNDSFDYSNFISGNYKLGDVSVEMEVVLYCSGLIGEGTEDKYLLFIEGCLDDIDYDIAAKLGVQNQELNYYYETIFEAYEIEDSPQIIIFDTEKNDYELFSILIPNPVFVKGKNGKVYAIFSGYMW